MEVAGLVCGDGVEPGLETTARIEALGREVDLQECILEDVVGGSPGPEKPLEELDQIIAISPHQHRECRGFTRPIGDEELLVRPRIVVRV